MLASHLGSISVTKITMCRC